jgi:phosphocarrier protein HPr
MIAGVSKMAERRVTVQTEAGLHARPAALFVQAATHAPMDVAVGRPDSDPVNAKSILSVLGLDVRRGEEIVITAEGDGAEKALDELAATVTTTGA